LTFRSRFGTIALNKANAHPMISRFLCPLAAVLLLTGSTLFADPIVVNGSFEDTTGPNILGWTELSGATPEFNSSQGFGLAEDGVQFLDISGGLNGGTASVSQTISGFTVGQAYLLSFYTSVNRNSNFVGPSSLTASIGSDSLTVDFAPPANQKWGSPWLLETLSFTATNSTLDLVFASGRTSTGSLPALDNVTIRSAVPEGGTTVCLLSVGLTTVFVARRSGLSRRSPAHG
jgi:Protein of unknown function (DUF642)